MAWLNCQIFRDSTLWADAMSDMDLIACVHHHFLESEITFLKHFWVESIHVEALCAKKVGYWAVSLLGYPGVETSAIPTPSKWLLTPAPRSTPFLCWKSQEKYSRRFPTNILAPLSRQKNMSWSFQVTAHEKGLPFYLLTIDWVVINNERRFLVNSWYIHDCIRKSMWECHAVQRLFELLGCYVRPRLRPKSALIQRVCSWRRFEFGDLTRLLSYGARVDLCIAIAPISLFAILGDLKKIMSSLSCPWPKLRI